jgi:hypothetical protein
VSTGLKSVTFGTKRGEEAAARTLFRLEGPGVEPATSRKWQH